MTVEERTQGQVDSAMMGMQPSRHGLGCYRVVSKGTDNCPLWFLLVPVPQEVAAQVDIVFFSLPRKT